MDEYRQRLMLKKNLLLLHAVCIIIMEWLDQNPPKIRKIWSRDFWERGEVNPYFATLMSDLRAEGEQFFCNFARVSYDQFSFWCEKVRPLVAKQNTFMRVAISIEERVGVTLQYLATGESYNSLATRYRISPSSVADIIPQVCRAF